jgi:hypothetical protein
MADQVEHPIVSVLVNGIAMELRKVLEMGLFRATLILLYSGIDQVSYLAMPVGNSGATRKDFANWVESRMGLQGLVTGEELYAARCAMLHKYGTEAQLHVNGKVTRQIGIVVNGQKNVYAHSSVPHLVCVEINYLVDAFIRGVLSFVKDLEYADRAYQNQVNARLHDMMGVTPADYA